MLFYKGSINKNRYLRIIAYILIFSGFNFLDSLQAQEKILDSQKGAKDLNFPTRNCEAYLNASGESYNKGDYENFKKYNDSALMVAKDFNLPKLQIKALINLGIYYNITDTYKQSLSLYHEALSICKTLPENKNTRVSILVNMANVYNKIDAHDKAIKAAEEVLELSETNNTSDLNIVGAYNVLSICHSNLGDQEKSLEYLFKMKLLGEKISHYGVILTALDNIANTYYKQSKYDQVIETEMEALEYLEKHSLPERPTSLLNLGMAYVKKEQGSKAIPYLNRAKEIANSQKDLELEKACYLHLARAYELLGDYKQSFEAQELYSEMNETLLEEKSSAAKLDVKHDAEHEKQMVESQLETLEIIDGKKTQVLIGSGVIFLLLGGMLFIYIKKKKDLEKDKEHYKESNKLLSNENKMLKTKMKELAVEKHQRQKTRAQYKNSSLTKEDRDGYMNLILDFMEKEKPFLDFDINQAEMAAKLSMSTHHLSEVLNLCFDQNFYQFINLYRVNEAQKLMKNPNYNEYKILAIGYEAGFKSKTSFNRVFKNHTGLTPSAYRQDNTTITN
ncbi:AraC family transcriptional regulator [Zhouia amylolytica]|uniref:HTH araC/xylS-type domain-containing protein n=1 Tax=Zhouia amylolytica AD3 TaxID=1286632 RepID=W2ULH9_9FLAO|nr:AraC family transcriptional regulator [Zhouia amylolytica]ETN94824.1 hypothetical protein P278_27670 [Zhouia amylolytica AD3]